MSKNENKKTNDRKTTVTVFLGMGIVLFAVLFILAAISFVWLKSYIVSMIPGKGENNGSTEYPTLYLELVKQASEKYGIEEERIFAVIMVESSFNPNACSSSDARGLMQMLPSTYKDVCERRGEEFNSELLYDPAVNIDVCTYYLSWLYGILGNWNNVHIAYNAGIGNVNEWLQDPQYAKDGELFNTPSRQANAYIKRINYYYNEYKNYNSSSDQGGI